MSLVTVYQLLYALRTTQLFYLIGDTRNSLLTQNYLKSLQVFSHESANHTAS